MPAHNLTLYANWIPISYTITLNANGAESMIDLENESNDPQEPTNITYTTYYDQYLDLADKGYRKT